MSQSYPSKEAAHRAAAQDARRFNRAYTVVRVNRDGKLTWLVSALPKSGKIDTLGAIVVRATDMMEARR